jgi:mannose-6-phosphate isomerase
MQPLYPLTFRPVFKRYLWGGRWLGSVLGKPIGPESDYAESWEVADHEQGQSIVADGPLAGTTLHELVMSRGAELLGRHAPQPRFPLLFKFLDCQRDLSVQVHPDDAVAAKLTPPDLGKTEAWVILDAQPGSRVYAGLRGGCDEAVLREAIGGGAIEQCLHSFEPRSGDCIFIPAGTVHALGAGLLVAEIQQASDTTYRLYDWGRVGPDGQPRKLHVEEALAVIDFSAVNVLPVQPSSGAGPNVERLVACDRFVLDRWTLAAQERLELNERCHLISVIDGALTINSSAGRIVLRLGKTALLPACVGNVELQPARRAIVLDMYLPD